MAMAAVAAAGATGTPQQLRGVIPARAASAGGLNSFVGLRGLGRVRNVQPLVQSRRGSVLSVRAATVTAPQFTTLKPLGDRLLVKISNTEEKSSGGILLPTSAQSKPQGGEVVEVGEGRKIGDKTLELSVKKGDQVVYSKFAGTEVDFNGEDFLLLKEEDIVGLLSTDDIKDLKPANDRVLIKVKEAESKTAGGVLLTDSAKEKPVVGDVIAAGPGTYGEDGEKKPLELKEGNTVLYSKYAGNDFKGKDGSQFVVLRASDVLAVLS
jgi:chaperonin GroES